MYVSLPFLIWRLARPPLNLKPIWETTCETGTEMVQRSGGTNSAPVWYYFGATVPAPLLPQNEHVEEPFLLPHGADHELRSEIVEAYQRRLWPRRGRASTTSAGSAGGSGD